MRENKLLNLLKGLFGASKDVGYFSSWAQYHLKYFNGDHVSLIVWFIFGWILLSALVLFVIYTLQGELPNRGFNILKQANNKVQEDKQENKRANNKVKQVNKKVQEVKKVMSKVQENKQVVSKVQEDKLAFSQVQEDSNESEQTNEISVEDNNTGLVYSHLASNLQMIHANMEELSDLAAKVEWNRVATAHEAEEVATLLYDRSWAQRPPGDSAADEWMQRFLNKRENNEEERFLPM